MSDGGNLSAAIASAADGDTIEIRSNQTFVRSLTWEDKYLTVKAGDGYLPTIRGPGSLPAIASISGLPGTGGLFQGLRLQGGNGRDAVDVTPAGSDHSKLTFRENELLNRVSFSEFSSSTLQVLLERNIFRSSISVSGTGSAAKGEFTVRENIIGRGLFIGGTGSIETNIVVDRNVIKGRVGVGSTGGSKLDALVTNNVIAIFDPATREPETAGIVVAGIASSEVKARFVNNTVVGFDYGIRVQNNLPVAFENMLLLNRDDIDSIGNGNFSIANSLISDGTFAGLNGNFSGEPNLGPSFELRSGSIGVDAGNNNAIHLPSIDLLGRPRILDGDGDSVSRVDVGAYELAVPEPIGVVLVITAFIQISIKTNRSIRRGKNS